MSYIFFQGASIFQFNSVQSLSRVQVFVTWIGMPGIPVHQTHVYYVGDDIQPSHPLSSPSPSALSVSQEQGLFQLVGSSHEVVKALEL